MSKKPYSPSENQVKNAVNRLKNRAENYLHNPERSWHLLENAVKKAWNNKDNQNLQPDFWTHLKAFFRLLKAYLRREYTAIPWRSIVLVVAAIIYFVSPIDLLLDWIPLAGFVDDAAVLVFVTRQIRKDLDNFLTWEGEKEPSGQIIDI